MKAKLIILNWCLSFSGLYVDTEKSTLVAVLLLFAWFILSSLLIRHAYNKGWLNSIISRHKIENEP